MFLASPEGSEWICIQTVSPQGSHEFKFFFLACFAPLVTGGDDDDDDEVDCGEREQVIKSAISDCGRLERYDRLMSYPHVSLPGGQK